MTGNRRPAYMPANIPKTKDARDQQSIAAFRRVVQKTGFTSRQIFYWKKG